MLPRHCSIALWCIKKAAGSVSKSHFINKLKVEGSRHFIEIFCLACRKSNKS